MYISSQQTLPRREVEAAPRLGVLRVQLRRSGGPQIRHAGEEHEALPGETRGREVQLQLGKFPSPTSSQVSGERNVLRRLPKV